MSDYRVNLGKWTAPKRVTLAKSPQIIPDSWALILDRNNLDDFAMFLAMRPAEQVTA